MNKKREYDTLNSLTFIFSILCIYGIRRISIVGEKAITDKEYKISRKDSAIWVLGVMSIYIFAYKGVYGFYKSFENLSFISTVYHIVIIIAAFQLVSASSKIQTVLKAIQANDITRN